MTASERIREARSAQNAETRNTIGQEGTTMSDDTYNGWKNYPTWAVNLWLSNDEGLADATRELVEQARQVDEGDTFIHNLERVQTADALKSWVRDDLAPDLGASFAADLLGYALDRVDWFEIADAWLEDAAD